MDIENLKEGHICLELPSGLQAVVRPYTPAVADALGDQGLIDADESYDKAVSLLIESVGGNGIPKWSMDKKATIKAVRDFHLNDYNFILFMAVAVYRDGEFDGTFQTTTGGKTRTNVELLDQETGEPLPQFQPAPYPLKEEKRVEFESNGKDWDAEKRRYVESAEVYEFDFRIFDGHCRNYAHKQEMDKNINGDIMARRPRFRKRGEDRWHMYDPKLNPPAWMPKIITKKIKEMDPVCDFSMDIKFPQGNIKVSVLATPDFFLQDFIT